MHVVRPTENYYYMEQSRIKLELIELLRHYSENTDPSMRLVVPAHQLRYAFMVMTGEENNPPYPAAQLETVRRFLKDSYQDPLRDIELSPAQAQKILDGIRPYRVYNRDNEPIVMRHLTHPDERCGFVNENLPCDAEREQSILESVLSLILDAQPAE